MKTDQSFEHGLHKEEDLKIKYTIDHQDLEIKITFLEIDKLKIHEETIQKDLEHLKEEIKEDKCIKHPIIVDEDHHIVLDGTHRVEAIRNLDYRLMLVALLDYGNPSIKVERWFRMVRGQRNEEFLSELNNYEIKSASLEEIENLLEKRKAIVGLITPLKSYAVLNKNEDIYGIYEKIKKIEYVLKSKGYKIGYETKTKALEKLDFEQKLRVLAVPKIKKEEITKTVLAGKIFMPKSTRHLTPARPLFVEAPLEWFELDLEEANQRLMEHLSNKKLKHLPSGQNLDRFYEEELYVFK